MKQIDHLDSLQHLDFPDSTKKEKRDKFGSLLLAVFGILGLLAINSSAFSYSNTGSIETKKTTKFWLTPSSLNAEKTAFNSSLNQSNKAEFYVSANTAANDALNYKFN